MELTDRKKQILKIVVDGYVATAEPVSSKAIAEKMPGRISSATIRNELADLVEMGYLEQPHTSAGRVPSARGYRLYVNELMERRALPEAEAESIRRSLTGQMSQVDQVMAQAGQLHRRGHAVGQPGQEPAASLAAAGGAGGADGDEPPAEHTLYRPWAG